MAETSLKSQIEQYCKNPHLRNLFMLLYETTSGHDHDGTNSKSVTVGAPGAGTVTNAMMATDVKIGSLAALTTTAKGSVQAAINELVTADTVFTAAILAIGVDIGNVATLTTTAKTLVGAINELDADNASFSTLTGVQTLTNKTLTSPIITTMLINDGDAGVTLTSADQTNASAVVTIPNIADAADTFCMIDTAQTLTLKTLTTPVIASIYQDAGKTKLMTIPDTASDTLAAIAATQTLTNKTLTTPIIASIYQDAGKTKLMTIPDTASDTLCAIAATQTLTNKTLTSPVITTMLINDGGTGLTLTSANQTHAAPTVTIPDIVDAADTFCMIDTEQTLTLKTLTTPVIASFYQDAGKTKLMTVPDTASDTLAAIAATQTLTNKTLTSPVVTSPDLTFGVSAHDYSAGHADWTLSASELKSTILTVTNSDQASNIIAPTTAGKVYIVYNGSASNIVIKTVAGTGVTIATTKTAIVRCDGVNYVSVTADA